MKNLMRWWVLQWCDSTNSSTIAFSRFHRIAMKAILAGLIISLSHSQSKTEMRDDFKGYFEEFRVEGSFALYDLKSDSYVFCNQPQFTHTFIPASTFKICNTLIGLETEVINDEHFVIKWDGVVRRVPEWNKDQDLQTAFKNSTVPYYQELARRVGGKRMKYWLDRAKYGNADTSGGIDRFWLTGGLRITPEQQIGFLRRLYNEELPFSKRSMDIVKKIMIVRDTAGVTLRAKTGWSDQDGKSIGWFVGYLQTNEDVYFFSTCIQCADANNPQFAEARREITTKILKALYLY
jgi:beta-lactamase class D